MQFIRRSEDNKFVYCVQPYTDIDNNLPYYEVARDDYATVLNLTEEQWDRVSLLAYYGYQYNENGYDHTAKKWYAITQVMIWRTTNPESDIYFTDTLNGNRITKYTKEMEEIEFLCDVIKTHMGSWTTDYNGVEVLEKPSTKYQNFVHMCDYLASRKCILFSFDENNNIID